MTIWRVLSNTAVFWGAVFLLLGSAVSVEAQVAVPDFTAGTARFFLPKIGIFNSTTIITDNPAAMQWSRNSRLAAGNIIHDGGVEEYNSEPSLAFEGNFGGASLVWDRISVGFDQIAVADKESGVNNRMSHRRLHLGFKVEDYLSFGLGAGDFSHQRTEEDPNKPGIYIPVEIQSLEELIGMSLKISTWLYLGYGLGRESMNRKDKDPATLYPSLSLDRSISQWGLAIRTEGKVQINFGLSSRHRESFSYQGMQLYETKAYYTRLQLIFAETLMAGLIQENFRLGPNPRLDSPDNVTTNSYDLAWVPMKGMTLSTRYTETNVLLYDPAPPFMSERKSTTRSVGVGYMF